MATIEKFVEGTQVRVTMYATRIEERMTNTVKPRPYLTVTLSDGVQEIDAKLWNYAAAIPGLKANIVVDIVGAVGSYGGKPQLTLTSITPAHNQDITPFIMSCGKDTNELWNALMGAIKSIEDQELQNVVTLLYTTHRQEIIACTAAKKIHHVGSGGLMQHTLEVYRCAVAIADIFDVPLSLVQAGALLHDIGKIETYAYDGAAAVFTRPGNLLGHIVQGIIMIHEAHTMLSQEKLDLLEHIIAAHHGKLEWGSPVTPQCKEAWIVHLADQLSATINTIEKAEQASGDAEETASIYTCGNMSHLTPKAIKKILETVSNTPAGQPE